MLNGGNSKWCMMHWPVAKTIFYDKNRSSTIIFEVVRKMHEKSGKL